jgi:hypothetical protein
VMVTLEGYGTVVGAV